MKHKVFTTTIVFLQQSVVCCAICGLKLCKTCSGTRWLMCSKWVASINDLVERKHTNPIVAHVSGSVNTWCSKHPNASHQDSTHTGWNSFLQLKCTFQYIYIYNIKPNLGLSSRIVVFSLITLDGRLKENFVTRTHIYQGCRSFRRRSRPVACWTSRPGCLAEVRYTVWHTYGVPYTIFWGEGMEAFGEHAGCPRSCLFASYISVERFSSKVSPFQKY